MSNETIPVTGATGNTGRRMVQQLTVRGFRCGRRPVPATWLRLGRPHHLHGGPAWCERDVLVALELGSAQWFVNGLDRSGEGRADHATQPPVRPGDELGHLVVGDERPLRPGLRHDPAQRTEEGGLPEVPDPVDLQLLRTGALRQARQALEDLGGHSWAVR
ncbi:hypothetical protein ACH4MW_00330 [Streptomyces luteogriseus]|uniref:hypothetical protein n=1 Tax=Streptomyces luteogriseus TaxID=68233 RepID=UPI0037B0EADD